MYLSLKQIKNELLNNNIMIFFKQADMMGRLEKIDSFGNLLLLRGENIGDRVVRDFT